VCSRALAGYFTWCALGSGSTGSTIIIDPTGANMTVVKSFSQISGEDQVWYDPTTVVGLFLHAIIPADRS
jgi:hypothetical protein